MFQSLSATRTGAGEAWSKTCQGPWPRRDFIPTQWILVAGVPWANAKAANYFQPWFSLFSVCHFSLWALDLHLGHQRLLAMAAESVWSWARAFPARKLRKRDIHLLKEFLHFLPWTWKQLTQWTPLSLQKTFPTSVFRANLQSHTTKSCICTTAAEHTLYKVQWEASAPTSGTPSTFCTLFLAVFIWLNFDWIPNEIAKCNSYSQLHS